MIILFAISLSGNILARSSADPSAELKELWDTTVFIAHSNSALVSSSAIIKEGFPDPVSLIRRGVGTSIRSLALVEVT